MRLSSYKPCSIPVKSTLRYVRSQLTNSNAQLKDYPGLVTLLAILLKFADRGLGHNEVVDSKTGLTFVEVLGAGSYCSVMLVKMVDGKFGALKVPKFVGHRAEGNQQLEDEVRVLRMLVMVNLKNDANIPYYLAIFCCSCWSFC
jgi:hypothetical protein